MQKSISKSGIDTRSGIEESLEQEAVGNRIEVGDSERIRHEGSGAGAAARAYRYSVLLPPVDEVLDDEEVAGKPHRDDHVEFALETLSVGGLVGGLAELLQLGEALLESGAGQLSKVVGLIHARRYGERGKLRLRERIDLAPTPLRDRERVFHRFRFMPEKMSHLLWALEVDLFRLVVRTLHVLERAPGADAHQSDLGLCVLSCEVVRAVGRDRGELEFFGERDEDFVEWLLFGKPVVLELDVERARFEQFLEVAEHGAAGVRALLKDGLRYEPGHARGEGDHALAVLGQEIEVDARGASIRSLDPATAHQPDEVVVAGLVSREQDEMVGPAGRRVLA